jgi:very-short-patch-repair endonuclease
MGIKHANRLAEALRQARIDDDTLNAFCDETAAEPLFVKNLERVQGDERDAVILSVGYGKHPDGRMRYFFGPLNQAGGERRLNVAITRARRRMTVVSSFSSADMDPTKLRAEGAQMLARYLQYAESSGANLGSVSKPKPGLDPFEADVRDQLAAAGVPLVVQHGCSADWIDFAAEHPDRPGEMVLAIECDGPGYQSSATARDRDRLRQEHLERLGWRFHRIWSTDWFHHRDAEIARAVEAYTDAVRRADSGAHLARDPEAAPADAADASAGAADAPAGAADARADVTGPGDEGRAAVAPAEAGSGDDPVPVGAGPTDAVDGPVVATGDVDREGTEDGATDASPVGLTDPGDHERADSGPVDDSTSGSPGAGDSGRADVGPGGESPRGEAVADAPSNADADARSKADVDLTDKGSGTRPRSVVAAPDRGARPPVEPGRRIVDYRTDELVALIRWIESDTLLRTEEELVAEVMRELGFGRKGSRITATITDAIHEARAGTPADAEPS